MVKKNKISKIILSSVNQLNTLVQRLPGRFEEEDLHQIRVRIKRLKALLRLLQSSQEHIVDITLPVSMKRLFAATGSIRNLQLFLHQAEQATTKLGFRPAAYIDFLQHELETQKLKSAKALPTAELIALEGQAVQKEADTRILRQDVKDFLIRRNRKIKRILKGKMQYQELHLLRKKLKDIQYNLSLYKRMISSGDQNAVKKISALLGHYCDACLALDHFKAYVRQCGNIRDPQSMAMQQLLIRDKLKLQNKVKSALSDLDIRTK
jgi:CHAD domain-containing protein